MMKIAFIGFGEAGQAYAGSLLAADAGDVAAYDILAGTAPGRVMAARAKGMGAVFCTTPEQALDSADIVFCAVTAAQSLEAIKAIASQLDSSKTVFDINSVSPGRKAATADIVRGAGARYVDMAVMAPVFPNRHRTKTFVAGDIAGEAEAFLRANDFDFERVGEAPGDATAIKMVRSLFVKGVEALTVQVLAAAQEAGCYDRIFASLMGSYDGLDWQTFTGYQMERVARHGVRRAAEMRECAVAMAELGFPDGAALADAVAALQDRVGSANIDPSRLGSHDHAAEAMIAALKTGQEAGSKNG